MTWLYIVCSKDYFSGNCLFLPHKFGLLGTLLMTETATWVFLRVLKACDGRVCCGSWVMAIEHTNIAWMEVEKTKSLGATLRLLYLLRTHQNLPFQEHLGDDVGSKYEPR